MEELYFLYTQLHMRTTLRQLAFHRLPLLLQSSTASLKALQQQQLKDKSACPDNVQRVLVFKAVCPPLLVLLFCLLLCCSLLSFFPRQ